MLNKQSLHDKSYETGREEEEKQERERDRIRDGKGGAIMKEVRQVNTGFSSPAACGVSTCGLTVGVER